MEKRPALECAGPRPVTNHSFRYLCKKDIMKKILFILLFLTAGVFTVQAQDPYFTIDDMPDLVKCLPAPPDTTSLDFTHDVMRYLWGKTMRSDARRAAIADRDSLLRK